MNLHRKIKWDVVGATISGLCIIHCIALPILLLFVPVLGAYTHWLEDYTHKIFLLLVIGAATLSFIPGYRIHRHTLPAILGFGGITLLLFAASGGAHEIMHEAEPFVAGSGSLLVILAHWVNHQKCKECTKHSCSED